MSRISDLYQSVTDSIIAELEAGAAPWVKPWKAGKTSGLMPANAATGRAYSGVNIPILWHAADVSGYETHGWMTLRQANSLGPHVRKGEHGSEVAFAQRVPIEWVDEGEEQATIPILRTYVVFNVGQIEGLKETAAVEPPATDAQVEAFIAATGADIRFGGDKALYVPSEDYIASKASQAADFLRGFSGKTDRGLPRK